jgi:hypothetical protein
MTAALKTDQTYLGIINTEAIVRAFTSERMRVAAEETVQAVAAESRAFKEDQERELTDRINTGISSVNDAINNGVTTIVQNVDYQLNEATQSFKAAQALDDWGDQYAQYVEELKVKLFGRIPSGLIGKNISTAWQKIVQNYNYTSPTKFRIILKPVAHFIAVVKLLWYLLRKSPSIIYVVIKNIYSLSGMMIAKIRSFAFQRAFWFTLLSVFVVVFVISSIVSIYDISEIAHIDVSFVNRDTDTTKSDTNDILVKALVYLPVVILLGLAYSFAVKNYRIYANMLDQYEHRRVVARTSKGIILSLPQESDDIRKTMTASAAQALFEHRNTGHLSKKEGESLSVLDIFRSVGK